MRDKRRFGPFLAGFAALGLALSAESAAQAQPKVSAIPDGNGKGFDTHLFRPALDSKGFFATNGTDILGKNDISFGLVLDYGKSLLRVGDRGQDDGQLINHSFQGTFQFNYGIANILVLGLTMPVNLMSGGAQVNKAVPPVATQTGPTASSVNGQQWFGNEFDSQTVSYIALHGKLRILRVERGFGLAVSTQVGIPVSDAPRDAGADPSVWVWPQVIGE